MKTRPIALLLPLALSLTTSACSHNGPAPSAASHQGRKLSSRVTSTPSATPSPRPKKELSPQQERILRVARTATDHVTDHEERLIDLALLLRAHHRLGDVAGGEALLSYTSIVAEGHWEPTASEYMTRSLAALRACEAPANWPIRVTSSAKGKRRLTRECAKLGHLGPVLELVDDETLPAFLEAAVAHYRAEHRSRVRRALPEIEKRQAKLTDDVQVAAGIQLAWLHHQIGEVGRAKILARNIAPMVQSQSAHHRQRNEIALAPLLGTGERVASDLANVPELARLAPLVHLIQVHVRAGRAEMATRLLRGPMSQTMDPVIAHLPRLSKDPLQALGLAAQLDQTDLVDRWSSALLPHFQGRRPDAVEIHMDTLIGAASRVRANATLEACQAIATSTPEEARWLFQKCTARLLLAVGRTDDALAQATAIAKLEARVRLYLDMAHAVDEPVQTAALHDLAADSLAAMGADLYTRSYLNGKLAQARATNGQLEKALSGLAEATRLSSAMPALVAMAEHNRDALAKLPAQRLDGYLSAIEVMLRAQGEREQEELEEADGGHGDWEDGGWE